MSNLIRSTKFNIISTTRSR